jgi:hypothetical protein
MVEVKAIKCASNLLELSQDPSLVCNKVHYSYVLKRPCAILCQS